MVYPYFVGPSYISQSRIAAGQECMNFYPEVLEVRGAKAQTALYPTPGVTSFATPGQAPGRGLFQESGRCFAVVHQTLYEIDSAGTLTTRGTVASNANPATMVTNGDAGGELLVTSGGTGYVLNLSTNTFAAQVSNIDFGGFLDGFFLGLDRASSTFKISALRDGTSWNSAHIAQRSAGADPWEAMLVAHQDIWLFGENTSEVWYNAGTAPVPFEPRDVFLEYGIEAAYSAARAGNTIMWLGRSREGGRIVYAADGYVPTRISTHAVETALRDYSDVSDAIGFSYQEEGHTFYQLNLPTANATWVYDLTTGWWHRRGYWNVNQGRFDRSRAEHHAYIFNRHLVQDPETGVINSQAVDQYSDTGGAAIRRVRRAPHLNAEKHRVFYPRFELDLESGVGLTTGQGSAPLISLSWSNDGGQTFGNPLQRSIGALGEYSTRVYWQRLGYGRDRVFEVAISDPVGIRIVNAYLQAEVGAH